MTFSVFLLAEIERPLAISSRDLDEQECCRAESGHLVKHDWCSGRTNSVDGRAEVLVEWPSRSDLATHVVGRAGSRPA